MTHKPYCLCNQKMTFLMDNKVQQVWHCQRCDTLRVETKEGDTKIIKWYERMPYIKKGVTATQ